MPPLADPAILRAFDVSGAIFITDTPAAQVWRVRRADGALAALKVYRGAGMGNEASGVSFLASRNGVGAAHIFDSTANAVLLEWLDGPHLGDLTRGGDDTKAAHYLLEVATALHSVLGTQDTSQYPHVADWLEDLFTATFAPECPPALRRDVMACQALGKDLLSAPQEHLPLHGDLHHDNVRLGERGYCAFDAKGVIGEKGYELANAFRNPKGAEKTVTDPERIAFLADLWSTGFGVPQDRLLAWAAVKCALSMVWQGKGTVKHATQAELLSLLLKQV